MYKWRLKVVVFRECISVCQGWCFVVWKEKGTFLSNFILFHFLNMPLCCGLSWYICRGAVTDKQLMCEWVFSFAWCVFFLLALSKQQWCTVTGDIHCLWSLIAESFPLTFYVVIFFFRWITFCSEPTAFPLLPSIVLDSTVWSCNCFSLPDRALALSCCSCCIGPVWVKIAPEIFWAECTAV